MAAPKEFAHGIDISRWDPSYNPHVRPMDFAILKASEGSTWHDPKFDDHLAACNSVDMLVGAYHYYRSGIPWRAQLDNFLRATQGKRMSKLMALDYEKINNTLTAATDKELREFYNALELLDFVPVIYLSFDEYTQMLRPIKQDGGDSGTASHGGGAAGSSAAANRGGGGGGWTSASGAGGAGVVIIRYAGIPRATGGTITQVGGYTIHTFTSSGNFVF